MKDALVRRGNSGEFWPIGCLHHSTGCDWPWRCHVISNISFRIGNISTYYGHDHITGMLNTIIQCSDRCASHYAILKPMATFPRIIFQPISSSPCHFPTHLKTDILESEQSKLHLTELYCSEYSTGRRQWLNFLIYSLRL